MDLEGFETLCRTKELGKRMFILAGREDFLKERALKKLFAAFVREEEQSESIHRLDGGSAGVGDVMDFLGQFSFGESHRVLVITAVEGFAAGERRDLAGKLAEAFVPEDVILCLLTRETPVATELEKKLGGRAERIDFWPPFENQLPTWIIGEARGLGLQMLPEAADQLLDLVGADLQILFREIEKMSFQAGKGGKITAAFVEENVRFLRQDSVFDLLEYFGYRNLPAVLRTVESLLQMGETPHRLWAMMQKTLREFRFFQDLRVDRPDLVQPVFDFLRSLVKLYGKSDFRANQERKRLTGAVQEITKKWPACFLDVLPMDQATTIRNMIPAVNFTRDELLRIWPDLEEMDLRLKSSHPNPKVLLQGFLTRFLTGRPA